MKKNSSWIAISLIVLCLSFIATKIFATDASGSKSFDYTWSKQDKAAFLTLAAKIKQISKTEKEFVIEKIPHYFSSNRVSTSFSNEAPEITNPDYPPIDSSNIFPIKKPEGLSDDEWQALRASRINTYAENGNVSYDLIDLNNDGLRDLITNAYVGGTGLFNENYLFRRQGPEFIANNFEKDEGYFYSINGRGSNQSASWIEINNQIYLLYVDSVFGEDKLLLKKPFADNAKNPVIKISYTYVFSVDKTQKPADRAEYQLEDKIYAAITKALAPLSQLTSSREIEDSSLPLCPNLQEDQAYNLGPGHYAFEIVANVPIWIDNQCYFGQVINWFGRYDANGLFAQLLYAHPDTTDSVIEVQVSAKRKIKHIRFETE
jgi:hypothetical protein